VALARRGNKSAQEELRGPGKRPAALEYLMQWFWELDRARMYDMNGKVAHTHASIKAWAELTGRQPKPHEIEALILLDIVSRFPDNE